MSVMAAISDERTSRGGHPGYAHIGSPDSDDDDESTAGASSAAEGIPLRVRREGTTDHPHDLDTISELGAAYYDYEAKHDDELSFERGSIIEIVDRNW